jgi:hypothetical protein
MLVFRRVLDTKDERSKPDPDEASGHQMIAAPASSSAQQHRCFKEQEKNVSSIQGFLKY